MKKSSLMIFLTSILLVFAVSSELIAQEVSDEMLQSKSGNANSPRFKFTKGEIHDFGTLVTGDTVLYTFEFINTGKDPLRIISVQGSCGCTLPKWSSQPVMGGEKGNISITFIPGQKTGIFKKEIFIQSNAVSDGDQYLIYVKGNVVKGKGKRH